MLLPKKVKHRKWHNPPLRGFARSYRLTQLAFGEFGLKSESAGWVTSREIEAARRAITRFVARGGKLWIRIFPDRPVTRKGSEVTMGGGKGAVDHYMCAVKSGMILFEIDGVGEETARQALQLARHKLSVRSRIIRRDQQ